MIEEYKSEVYLGIRGYWRHFKTFSVNAGSLEEAVKISEEKAREELKKENPIIRKKEPFIHVDRVSCNNEILYDTVWDASGPLVAYESERKNLFK